MSKAETVILASREELVEAAAKMITQKLSAMSNSSKEFHLALTGGTVGTLTLEALADKTKSMDLSRLHIWWVDERYVPRNSSERNELQARNAWLSSSDVQETNIHAFPADETNSIEDSARSFASHIESIEPKFDLVLLGMGEDGHVASLFPGSTAAAFGEWVIVEKNSPKPPRLRLSLSMKAINSSREVFFLVSGSEKAQAVSDVISGVGNLPAQSVSGMKKTLWLLDEDAASMLISF